MSRKGRPTGRLLLGLTVSKDRRLAPHQPDAQAGPARCAGRHPLCGAARSDFARISGPSSARRSRSLADVARRTLATVSTAFRRYRAVCYYRPPRALGDPAEPGSGFGLIARALDVGQRFFELVFPHVGIAIVRRHRQFVGEPQLALKFGDVFARLRFFHRRNHIRQEPFFRIGTKACHQKTRARHLPHRFARQLWPVLFDFQFFEHRIKLNQRATGFLGSIGVTTFGGADVAFQIGHKLLWFVQPPRALTLPLAKCTVRSSAMRSLADFRLARALRCWLPAPAAGRHAQTAGLASEPAPAPIAVRRDRLPG